MEGLKRLSGTESAVVADCMRLGTGVMGSGAEFEDGAAGVEFGEES